MAFYCFIGLDIIIIITAHRSLLIKIDHSLSSSIIIIIIVVIVINIVSIFIPPRSGETDKSVEIQKRDLELNETKKQLVKIELQAQKRSQQIVESKKEIATLQLKIEELEEVRTNYRVKEKKLVRDLATMTEELNRRDANIAKLNGEMMRNEDMLGTADTRFV